MKKLISVNKKSRGRPKKKGGVDPVTAVRLPKALSDAVETWAADQKDEPVRSEAIRRLVELGLSQSRDPGPRVLSTAREAAARAAELAAKGTASQRPKPAAKPGHRTRAKELARDAIEKIADPAASPEERDQRRRRLTKGPLEFRQDRVDQPKRKG
jgi:hypothetical protein